MSRRIARQTALQLLYQIDLTNSTVDEAWDLAVMEVELAADAQDFARKLVSGVIDNLTEIDQLIERFAKDWAIERMSIIDRNILRIAIYELKYLVDIPVKVSINEAVEMAKEFSNDQAARFINGILGTVVDFFTRSLYE